MVHFEEDTHRLYAQVQVEVHHRVKWQRLLLLQGKLPIDRQEGITLKTGIVKDVR